MKKETRHERFLRLAEKRTNKIINDIRILGNCSNKSSYEYKKKEVDKIFSAIIAELKLSRNKFTFNDDSKKKAFKL